MTIPLVPVLEPVPLRGDQPEPEFQENVVTFLDALPDYSEAQNAQATAMNETAAAIDAQAAQVAADTETVRDLYDLMATDDASEMRGSSTTSITIGTGAKSFVTQAGKLWRPTQWLLIRSQANPANYMSGPITAYDVSDGNPLTLDVQQTGGSGTFTDWQIYAVGAPVVREQWELIGSPISTASGTSWTINPLPNNYADLLVDLAGVQQSSGGPRSLLVQLYDGTTWQSAGAVASNISSATPFTGHVNIWGYGHDLIRVFGNPNLGQTSLNSASVTVTGGAKGIRFLWAGNDTGTAGTIRVWGK
ncbi:hypothetical protein [Novosphingobium sp. JCM 18896]|uniref:hypothetical protein n=1 Tax=Novosphingobium sp. JCM 18896 TaxID=2989731 RepID=UPI002222FE8C|nr:hypothetical protein [Novosphingobium sp. JCM 18896]MCW1431408.1 hypothetical protein [Novosphingobium sp. JCM 18896]